MEFKKSLTILWVAVPILCAGIAAQADVFNLGSGLKNLEMVTVGDPGNAADTRYADPGYGSVNYVYNIGKYDVTVAQYCDFLNHKAQSDPYWLYGPSPSSHSNSAYSYNIQRGGTPGSYSYSVAGNSANLPMNYVSYWDACRFVNWLNNGQGDGDTETGAYTLNGYNEDGGLTIARNTGAKWFLPTEDEWYKAAHYKGGGANAGYWDYPTQSDIAPGNQLLSPDPGNSANCNHGYYSDYYLTDVGAFSNSESAYGTFDQGGNVAQWNEAVQFEKFRGLRGGDFGASSDSLQASCRWGSYPTWGDFNFGFRVAEAVPEPSSLAALICGLAGVGGAVVRRRR